MNLFGLEITLGRRNGEYVKRTECHEAQDSIKHHIDKCLIRLHSDMMAMRTELKSDINTRFDDIKSNIETLKDFVLRNGRH